jgi:hypothetical protein
MRLAFLALLFTCACAMPGGAERHGKAPEETPEKTEIEELHAFFEGWFTGRLEHTPAAFARFDDVIAAGFVLVSPEGARLERADLAPFLDGAYRSHVDDGFRIWIENIHVRRLTGGYVQATYEEWQETTGAEPRGRVSSALFRERAGTPNGLEWIHVHETWLASP